MDERVRSSVGVFAHYNECSELSIHLGKGGAPDLHVIKFQDRWANDVWLFLNSAQLEQLKEVLNREDGSV